MLAPANSSPSPWDAFWQEIEAIYSGPHQKPTRDSHWLAWSLLSKQFPDPGEITKGGLILIRQRLIAQGYAPQTVRSRLATIRTECNHLEDLGLLKRNPFARKRHGIIPTVTRAEREKVKRHLTVDEIRRILAQADQEYAAAEGASTLFRCGRLRALVYTLAYTGFRKGEILYLRRQDIEWEKRIIRVTGEVHRTKTEDSMAPVAIHEKGLVVLYEWAALLMEWKYSFIFPVLEGDRPWLNGADAYRPTGQVKALGERAGVAGADLKVFRHSIATHLRHRFGAGREDVKRTLRHSNTRTQDYYVHDRDEDNLRGIADLINYEGTENP